MTLAQIAEALVAVEEVLIVIRVLVSWFPGISPWSPWMRWLRRLVDPVLDPFRRFLPALGGIDISPLFALIVLDAVRGVLHDVGAGYRVTLTYALAVVFRELIVNILILAIIVVALRALLSFFRTDPWSPMVRMVRDWSTPLVRPFTRVVPRSRSGDLPAVVAAVVLILLLFVVVRPLLDALVRNTI